MGYCHTNACVVRHASTLENKYSNIFFYKTTGPTVLKFQGLRIVKLGQVEYPRWPLLLKIVKTTKSTYQETLDILAEFWHGISVKHRYSEL